MCIRDRSWLAGDVEDVLHRDGDAEQVRGRMADRTPPIGNDGLGQRLICVDIDEGVDHRLGALELLVDGSQQLDRGKLSIGERLASAGQGEGGVAGVDHLAPRFMTGHAGSNGPLTPETSVSVNASRSSAAWLATFSSRVMSGSRSSVIVSPATFAIAATWSELSDPAGS